MSKRAEKQKRPPTELKSRDPRTVIKDKYEDAYKSFIQHARERKDRIAKKLLLPLLNISCDEFIRYVREYEYGNWKNSNGPVKVDDFDVEKESDDKCAEKSDKDEDLSVIGAMDTKGVAHFSPDGKWLLKHVGLPLKMALVEIVAKKPYDPVEYLGFWLKNYKRCRVLEARQKKLDSELSHLRSLIKDDESANAEYIPENEPEGEEEQRDWSFKDYKSQEITREN